MKWFKHIVDSGDDPDLDDAVSIFGAAGYYVFFRTLEVMAREFDIKNPGKNEFSVKFFRKKFHISFKKVSEILQYFHNKSRIFVEFHNGGSLNKISLNCPKLKELTDNWTDQVKRKNYEVTTKKLSNHIEVEEEVDIDTNIKAQKSTPPSEKENEFLLSELKDLTEKLYQQKIFPQVYAFLNKALKEKKNIKAILYTLKQCLLMKPKEPWGYCVQILKIENGNFNEHDHAQKGKEHNNLFLQLAEHFKPKEAKGE